MNIRNILTDCTAVIVLVWHWFLGACPTFILVGTAVLIAFQLKYWYRKTFVKHDRRASDRAETGIGV